MSSIRKAFETKSLQEMNHLMNKLEIKIGFLGTRKWVCKGYQGSITLNHLFAYAVQKAKRVENASELPAILAQLNRMDQTATLALKQTRLAKFFHFIPHTWGRCLFNRSKAKRLLRAKIERLSLHHRNTLGETLLHAAIRDSKNNENIGFIEDLINQGVRPFYPVIAHEEDPITLAISLNLLKTAIFLFKKALSKRQLSSSQLQTLLSKAIYLQNVNAVEVFLKHGAKKNEENIRQAKRVGNKQILALLQS